MERVWSVGGHGSYAPIYGVLIRLPSPAQIAGDGTTTATVLTRAIFSEGCKAVAAGMNPMDLRRGINLAVETVLADLKVLA